MTKRKSILPLPPDAWFEHFDRSQFPPLSVEDFAAESQALNDPLIRSDAVELLRTVLERKAVLRGRKALRKR